MTTFSLSQGQYFTADYGEKKTFLVQSGTVDVFACTPKGQEHYHKMFLTQLGKGEAFFSLTEILSPIEIQLFAISDCVVEAAGVDETEPSELAGRASEWFFKLTALPWVKYLAGMEDETVSKWDSRSVFGSGWTGAQIRETLLYNTEILSMLIGAQFKKTERKMDVKTEARDRHRDKVLSAAMQNLLKTEYAVIGGTDPGDGGDDPVKFAVRAAAESLGMNTGNISLPEDIGAHMDSVTRMRRLVQKANMQVRLVSLPPDWHKNDNGTLLAHDGVGMAALLPRKGKRYVLVSESHPLGLPVDDKTASQIKSEAFLCYAGLPPKKLGKTDIFQFMLRHSAKHDWVLVWLMSLAAGVLPILLPLITESLFRDVIPINDRQALATVTQVMLVSGFTAAVVGFVRSISLLRIKSHVSIAFESALWSRLLSLPVKFFKNYDVGNLVGRMQGISGITEMLGDNVLSAVFNMFFSFWSVVLMFYYNVKLTILSLAGWTVYLLINVFLYRKIIFVRRHITETSNKASARTLQLLNGMEKFRLQGGEASAFHLWSQTFGENWTWNLKSRRCSNYISLINAVTFTLLTMVLYYVIMNIVEADALAGTPGLNMDSAKFLGFQTAFSGFNAALLAFVPVVSNLFSALPLIDAIMPILESEPEATDDKTDVSKLSGEIRIENLHFAYAPNAPMVLNGISLCIKAGESVAFVGPSGCGKSTLLRVLLGFEKPSQGAIFFDGQDFSTLNAASVRSQMGVVLQNGQIMQGDIFSNIVGSAPLTVDDAWEAARMVGLDKDIENMPMGMNTVISEGAGNVSGGQRQRLLLARSIVNRPKIVILDEATSALDNVTQAIVTESMNKLKATRVIVAHRLSTIKDADRICVLQDGRIAEEGNYEELMKTDGLFAKLAKRQLG